VTARLGVPGLPSVAHSTWDTTLNTSYITYSNVNLTATWTTFQTGGAAARNTAVNSGTRCYFEITPSTTVPAIGLADSSYPTASGNIGADVHSLYYASGGSIYYNNGPQGSPGTWSAGAVVGFAIDFTLSPPQIWARASPSSNWNGNASYSPNVGSQNGGIALSGISTSLYIIAQVGFSSGDAATVNTGSSAYSGGLPTGFSSCW
jgi:hypothetical protein